MCVVVYIAADHPLPLIPWDENSPTFHVSELTEREVVVRRHFGKPYAYYVGSHEGCGCGFQYGWYPDLEVNDETRVACVESRRRLVMYLERALERSAAVELYTCWDGERENPSEHRSTSRPTELLTGRTYFLDREFLTVRGDPGGDGVAPQSPAGAADA